MRSLSRIRETATLIASARLPSVPKRRYDLIAEAMGQAVSGQGGGRGPIRDGGVEEPKA